MIHDVIIKPLKVVFNSRGHLMEVQRNDDDCFLGFGQVYITSTFSGIVKAWYRHHKQIDQIALVKGALLLVLYDSREGSETYNTLQEIYIYEENPLLVQIPPGIWHGFKSIGTDAAYLMHLNSIAFSSENTDEDRMAYDDPLIPFNWLVK